MAAFKHSVIRMQLPRLDECGQTSSAVTVQLTLIISLIVAVIIVYQLGVAKIGPTKYPYQDENGELSLTYDNVENKYDNPNYDASALAAYNNVVVLSWAGIALMGVAIIILAASVILSVVGGFGGTRV